MGQRVPAFLEHYAEEAGTMRRVALDPLPFTLGRSKCAHFPIYSDQVSREHAQIIHENGEYYIVDLHSTNGTFLNGTRVVRHVLRHGDILHIGKKEFSFGTEGFASSSSFEHATHVAQPDDSRPNVLSQGRLFREMMAARGVQCYFQRIVDFNTHQVIGYEALGRGNHGGLPTNPMELFHLAQMTGQSIELSQLFREMAVILAAECLPPRSLVFLNTHPFEIDDPALLCQVGRLREKLAPEQTLVLEVHEASVTQVGRIRSLRDRLFDEGILLAYDDFGAGQARLLELVESPPAFVKLDMGLIRGLDCSEARQELVQALVRVGNSQGIYMLAEGVETLSEAEACRRLGCTYAQGFFYGKPEEPDKIILPQSTLCRLQLDTVDVTSESAFDHEN